MARNCRLMTALVAAGLASFFSLVSTASPMPRLSGAQESKSLSEEARAKILQGLEKGMWALRELGLEEDAGRLQEVARRLGRSGRTGGTRERNPEREQAIQDLELMGAALGALREARREDAADLLERAVRARKLVLAGRRDEEARAARERAPDIAQQAELLMLAAELYADWGHERRAADLGALGRRYAEIARRRLAARESAPREREAEPRREVLELLRLARAALREGERAEQAARIERAIHVRELELEGREGADLREAREQAPGDEELVDLLEVAARLYQGWGHPDRAEAVAGLARRIVGEAEEHREGESAADGSVERLADHLEELVQHTERLTLRVERLEEMVERLLRARRDR